MSTEYDRSLEESGFRGLPDNYCGVELMHCYIIKVHPKSNHCTVSYVCSCGHRSVDWSKSVLIDTHIAKACTQLYEKIKDEICPACGSSIRRSLHYNVKLIRNGIERPLGTYEEYINKRYLIAFPPRRSYYKVWYRCECGNEDAVWFDRETLDVETEKVCERLSKKISGMVCSRCGRKVRPFDKVKDHNEEDERARIFSASPGHYKSEDREQSVEAWLRKLWPVYVEQMGMKYTEPTYEQLRRLYVRIVRGLFYALKQKV